MADEPQSGTGLLAPVHVFTITAALLCFLGYAVWEFVRGPEGAILRGTFALVAAGVTGAYLRGLRARLAIKLTPGQPSDH